MKEEDKIDAKKENSRNHLIFPTIGGSILITTCDENLNPFDFQHSELFIKIFPKN